MSLALARTSSPPDILAAATADFMRLRPRLHTIAYRLLGGWAEAEDVVQDVWLRWQTCDRATVRNPTAFLVTTTTRRALNVAQSARLRRELCSRRPLPEAVDVAGDPGHRLERRGDVERGLLILVDRLVPAERAAFVLRHAFDYPYPRIAAVLHTSEVNARQLVSRAARRLALERRVNGAEADHRCLAQAFLTAAAGGDLRPLEHLLAADSLRSPRTTARTPWPRSTGRARGS